MSTRTVSGLESILERLEKQPAAGDVSWISEVAAELSKTFHVENDEIAIMELASTGKVLRFVLPEKLRAVGSIPLTSTAALAARTARDRRSDIVNNFASSRHASVFEGVPLGQRQGQGHAIQKIMSAPILRGDKVIGVAQISRKGSSISDAGPDFTSKDLIDLQNLNNQLGRFLALWRTSLPE